MTADTPTPNPFLEAFNQTTASLDPDRLKTIFHDSTSPDERGVLFNEMCDAGESLVNEFGWAVPTERVLTILKHFSPIVEIGSGANAYLGHLSKAAMIDINCYDIAPLDGGLLTNNKKRKLTTSPKTSITLPGGPSVLQNPENKNKTLLLCFPDQFLQEDSDIPMALSALKNFTGEHIIHIGELYGDTVAHDHQAPFGRSSSPDFQIQLATDFHCLLKIELPHWPHEGTTCSVWKRTKTCELVFDDDEDSPDDDDTESNSNSDSLKYANIPPNEQLPRTISTPSTRHLSGLPCCKNVELTLLPETFMVAKFPCDSAEGMIIASNILVKGIKSPLFVAPTCDEISVICNQEFTTGWDKPELKATLDPDWRCYKVKGPMPFYLVGVMASLSTALAAKDVSLLAQSTFDTDYILVGMAKLEKAREALLLEGCILH